MIAIWGFNVFIFLGAESFSKNWRRNGAEMMQFLSCLLPRIYSCVPFQTHIGKYGMKKPPLSRTTDTPDAIDAKSAFFFEFFTFNPVVDALGSDLKIKSWCCNKFDLRCGLAYLMEAQGMSHVKHNCLKMGFLFGAMCLFVDCATGNAAQKIIFSDPATPVEISSSAPAARKELFQDTGAEVSPFASRGPKYNTRMSSIPDVIIKKDKNKDWLSSDENGQNEDLTDRQKQMLKGSRSSRLERSWETDRTMDPATREYDKKRAQSALNSREDDYGAETGPWNDRRDLNSRKTKGLSEFSSEGLHENPLEKLQEAQFARIEEFKKLYEMPSAVTPVSSPNDAANSPLNSPWGQQPTKHSLSSLPDAARTQEIYTRGQSSLPSRGLGESTESRYFNPSYHESTRDPNQPDPTARQPGVLNFPKRPGSLLR